MICADPNAYITALLVARDMTMKGKKVKAKIFKGYEPTQTN
jgi:hypothetical protein